MPHTQAHQDEGNAMAHTLLAILAHPDDESFGIGGTLARYAAEGVQLMLICATRGEAGIRGLSPEQAGRVREQELLAAARTLSVQARFLGYRDGELAQADPKQVIGQNPPYPGRPEEEATRLACHEYFTLARPASEAAALADLFAGLSADPPQQLHGDASIVEPAERRLTTA